MKRIVFAWELGKATGHTAQLVALAKEFHRRHWDVVFVLRNPESLTAMPVGFEYRLLPAPYKPVLAKPGQSIIQPLLFSDDLLPAGYGEPELLASLLLSWRDTLALLEPDVVVCQAAPPALLAARQLSLVRVNFGRGYDVPPLCRPMPALRYWESVSLQQRQDREDVVMRNINTAMTLLGWAEVPDFASVLEADLRFCCDFPELSHYPTDLDDRKRLHTGPLLFLEQGESVTWRATSGRRILVQMQAYMTVLPNCLKALRQMPDEWDIIVVCPGLPEGLTTRINRPNLRVYGHALRFSSLLPDCNLLINYASAGMVHAAALHGIPLLMFPTHIEQNMVARAVVRTGMGISLGIDAASDDIVVGIRKLLTDTQYLRCAQSLASKYAGHDTDKLAARLADQIGDQVAQSRAP